MQAHIFKGSGDWYGATLDPTGQNLPPEHGPWKPFGTKALVPGQSRIAMDVNAAIKAIDADGYFVWQASVKVSER